MEKRSKINLNNLNLQILDIRMNNIIYFMFKIFNKNFILYDIIIRYMFLLIIYFNHYN